MFWQLWMQAKASCRGIHTSIRVMESTSIWRKNMPNSYCLDASTCFNMLQEALSMKRLGATDLFATDATKICVHISQYEFQ